MARPPNRLAAFLGVVASIVLIAACSSGGQPALPSGLGSALASLSIPVASDGQLEADQPAPFPDHITGQLVERWDQLNPNNTHDATWTITVKLQVDPTEATHLFYIDDGSTWTYQGLIRDVTPVSICGSEIEETTAASNGDFSPARKNPEAKAMIRDDSDIGWNLDPTFWVRDIPSHLKRSGLLNSSGGCDTEESTVTLTAGIQASCQGRWTKPDTFTFNCPPQGGQRIGITGTLTGS